MKIAQLAIIPLALLVGTFAVLWGLTGANSDKAYAQRILDHRAEVEEFMFGSPDSPILPEDRAAGRALQYYDPDRSYSIRAEVVSIPQRPQPLILATSADTLESYYPHSRAVFTLEGMEHRLVLLESREGQASNRLFLAFTDATSGDETYAGGRYLDVYPQGDGTVEIDFNLAYNPYCVYDKAYVCPLPPPENRLTVPIRAGEKNYH